MWCVCVCALQHVCVCVCLSIFYTHYHVISEQLFFSLSTSLSFTSCDVVSMHTLALLSVLYFFVLELDHRTLYMIAKHSATAPCYTFPGLFLILGAKQCFCLCAIDMMHYVTLSEIWPQPGILRTNPIWPQYMSIIQWHCIGLLVSYPGLFVLFVGNVDL